ncbi:N-acetyltransferase [Caulobacter sp. RHG1]|uniref:GNAT family N-acetyltransferase n=1 Tax=Caulobacter sp. (strain RHG1) TaxID=2545762 RepID=UPI0015569478|nr:GNAT family N-acetyltransferase [Caulobacter sp. RHG1]NQE63811.1 acetyltransferase, GNAT family [Caulobacter sp. RHG1]
MSVRSAEAADLAPLALLWWRGWRDAHLPIVPKALATRSTLDSFIDRMAVAMPRIRTMGPVGAPFGFHLIKGDELHQLYVAEESRGAGIAALLMIDAENRLLEAGATKSWLACTVGNTRAARFYQKAGWTLARTQTLPSEIPGGWFPLKAWRYEKTLTQRSAWAARAESEQLEARLPSLRGSTEDEGRQAGVYLTSDGVPWGRRAGDRLGSRQV